jgi:N-acetylglucosamine-6-sulfatase
MQAGKGCPYEEDVNVPLIIRGPGIKENAKSDIVTSHQDLAPTIMELAGEAQRPDFDGSPIPVKECEQSEETDRQEHVGIEFWGVNGLGEGLTGEWGQGLGLIPGLD